MVPDLIASKSAPKPLFHYATPSHALSLYVDNAGLEADHYSMFPDTFDAPTPCSYCNWMTLDEKLPHGR